LLPPDTIFKAKLHQIRFRLGLRASASDAAGGAHRAPTDPLTVFKGPIYKGVGREGNGGQERGSEGKRREQRRPSAGWSVYLYKSFTII